MSALHHCHCQDGGGSIDIDEVIKLVIGLFTMGGVEVWHLMMTTKFKVFMLNTATERSPPGLRAGDS